MPYLPAAIHAALARQHGVVGVDQMLDAGLERRQIDRLASAGAIELVLRGVYRSPSVTLTEASRCAAVCLANRSVVIAGPTAGRVWAFRRLPADARVWILAPPASNPAVARWIKPYRTAAIHPHDVVDRPDGIRVTTRARTAFDLARVLSADDLLSVIEQSMRDGRLEESEMREVAVDWLSPRRPWVRTYLRQLDRRLAGGPAESHAEVVVAERLRDAGIRGIVRQHEVDLPGYGPARFDLAIPRLRWAIEIDLFPTHDETIGRQRDKRRDIAATTLGWTMTRLVRQQYEESLDAWIAMMVRQRDLLEYVERQSSA